VSPPVPEDERRRPSPTSCASDPERASRGLPIDAKAAGELLGVPPSWVLAKARADVIPHTRLGHYVRFFPDDLLAWARSRSRGPAYAQGRASSGPGDVGAPRGPTPKE
jgi:hypothetical protein